ncbi:MAG: hypothetical protein BMS9Abin10_0499 [Gammaproteobacteria bacterium]|nr:MAG: hypothetical protein BMS9Abin10_0499 [Gammaproteobacteria bacterium]
MDLKWRTCIGGLLFLGYYAAFLLALEWSAPGYIEHVCNLEVLIGIAFFGLPIEELLFAFGFGMYGSGVYERHVETHNILAHACTGRAGGR